MISKCALMLTKKGVDFVSFFVGEKSDVIIIGLRIRTCFLLINARIMLHACMCVCVCVCVYVYMCVCVCRCVHVFSGYLCRF